LPNILLSTPPPVPAEGILNVLHNAKKNFTLYKHIR
jgi:hypothetical protein